MTRFERAYQKVEALRKQQPGLRTSELMEMAKVTHANYYRGRRQVLDAKTPTKLAGQEASA